MMTMMTARTQLVGLILVTVAAGGCGDAAPTDDAAPEPAVATMSPPAVVADDEQGVTDLSVIAGRWQGTQAEGSPIEFTMSLEIHEQVAPGEIAASIQYNQEREDPKLRCSATWLVVEVETPRYEFQELGGRSDCGGAWADVTLEPEGTLFIRWTTKVGSEEVARLERVS